MRTPHGDHYLLPHCEGTAVRVTRVAAYADGSNVNGLIGWAVNQGAQGAVETVQDWGLLPTVEARYETAKKRGHQLRATARDQGSLVHRTIDLMLQGIALPWQVDAGGPHIHSFVRFMAECQPEIIDRERTLFGTYDGETWWGGTTDVLAKWENGRAYIDWKTTKERRPPSPAYIAQLGGYLEARHWSESDDDMALRPSPYVDHAVLVQLTPTDYFVTDIDTDHAKELWRACWHLHQTVTEKENA